MSTAPAEEITALFATARVLARVLARPWPPEQAPALRRRLSRLARALVRVAEANDPAFLGLTALAEAHRDPAGRAALEALLAIAAARELTTSRAALVRLALVVLIVGAGEPPEGRLVRETPDEARRVPVRAAASVLALFGAAPAALRLADAVFEAAWMPRQRALGPLDRGGLEPHVAARIFHVVRALLERIAPADGSPSRPPLEALVAVGKLRSVDPAAYRCLVRALGVTPAGSLVELSGGEWAVVLAPASAVDPMDRPRVRILTDGAGRARTPPVEIDLAAPEGKGYAIARLVDPGGAPGYVLAAFGGGP